MTGKVTDRDGFPIEIGYDVKIVGSTTGNATIGDVFTVTGFFGLRQKLLVRGYYLDDMPDPLDGGIMRGFDPKNLIVVQTDKRSSAPQINFVPIGTRKATRVLTSQEHAKIATIHDQRSEG